MTFEIIQTVSQALDSYWGEGWDYTTKIKVREGTKAQNPCKRIFPLQLPRTSEPQIRSYTSPILKANTELCSHYQNYRISVWKETCFHSPFFRHFTPLTICLSRSRPPYFNYLQWGITHCLPRKLILSPNIFDCKNTLHKTELKAHLSTHLHSIDSSFAIFGYLRQLPCHPLVFLLPGPLLTFCVERSFIDTEDFFFWSLSLHVAKSINISYEARLQVYREQLRSQNLSRSGDCISVIQQKLFICGCSQPPHSTSSPLKIIPIASQFPLVPNPTKEDVCLLREKLSCST